MAIDVVIEKHPQYLLHGHEPLTMNLASASMLAQLKTDLVGLNEQVLTWWWPSRRNQFVFQRDTIPKPSA